MPRAPILTVLDELVAWYAARVYGALEGPGRVPFYCDPARVGGFAVDPAAHDDVMAVWLGGRARGLDRVR